MRNLMVQEHAPRQLPKELLCECGGRIVLDFFAGEEICSKCGMVIAEKLEMADYDDIPELRFENGKDAARTYEMDRPLVIKPQTVLDNHDAFGKKLLRDVPFLRMQRMQVISQRDKRARVKVKCLFVISSMKKAFSFNNAVEDRARQIMERIILLQVTRGRHADKLSKAAVFIAMSEYKFAVGFKTFCEVADIDGPVLRINVRLISEKLGIKLETCNPVDMVSRIVNALVNVQELREAEARGIKLRAVELLEKVRDDPRAGGSAPAGIAAAAVYIASCENNLNVRQSRLFPASGISTVTIRKAVCKLCEILNIKNLLPVLGKEED